ncbi:RNA polymerase sigma factor [Sphingopyxis sp. KK2]|uniref:RNA polymerase sigma factor n=1 Tax=Sphingopyxis sp. KK2 TaxID=1855727 RepID=UPI00097E7423|nr:sigma-70 family RNA polymerase sigma factor [Sphingopyxis sp. KK2]
MASGETPTALQQVMLGERSRLVRFLAARGAGDEAEDLFHELWQKIASLSDRPVGDPRSYLFRAAENLMRDMRRATLSRARRQSDWHDLGDTPQERPAGERALIAREQLAAIDATLAALGPRVDRIFRRYRLDGAGQADIATEWGISLSSVEKDLQKAYRALAELKAGFDAE